MRNRVLLVVSVLAASLPLAGAELVEKIVARVNDRLITSSEFETRFAVFISSPQAGNNPLEAKRKLLSELIDEKLLEEPVKDFFRPNLWPNTPDILNEYLQHGGRRAFVIRLILAATLGASYGIYGPAFELMEHLPVAPGREEYLGSEKYEIRHWDLDRPDSLADLIARVNRIRRENPALQRDDTLRLEYERRKDQLYKTPDQANVGEIVIRFDANDPAARARAASRIEEARAKIAAGTSFADVAKQYSEGNAKERGGALGSVNKGELVTPLDAAVFSDPPQEFPPAVLLSSSVHLFHVTDRKPAGYRPFAEVKEDLRARIGDDLYDKRYGEYIQKLRREAFIKIYDPALAAAREEKKTS